MYLFIPDINYFKNSLKRNWNYLLLESTEYIFFLNLRFGYNSYFYTHILSTLIQMEQTFLIDYFGHSCVSHISVVFVINLFFCQIWFNFKGRCDGCT